MSTTIGIGYSPIPGENFFHKLEELSNKFGYGLLDGVSHAEADVLEGLEITKNRQGWENIALLQSPPNSASSLAFGIHEELTKFETEGKRPRFFDFIIELSEISSESVEKLAIFFAGEWYKKDKVRFSYGTAQDLITLLSMPGNWGVRYMIPETGNLHDSDETPLLFEIKPPH